MKTRVPIHGQCDLVEGSNIEWEREVINVSNDRADDSRPEGAQASKISSCVEATTAETRPLNMVLAPPWPCTPRRLVL
eukprot:4206726-Amphidinium_carterae.1